MRFVFLSEISTYDWDRGARGESDFWDVVACQVMGLRRLEEESIVQDGHPECDHEQGANVHPGCGCGCWTEHERQPECSTLTSSAFTNHDMSTIGVRQQLNATKTGLQRITVARRARARRRRGSMQLGVGRGHRSFDERRAIDPLGKYFQSWKGLQIFKILVSFYGCSWR